MYSDSVMCFQLIHGITAFLFLISCVYSDQKYCYSQGGGDKETICSMSMQYPLMTSYTPSQRCGYPVFEVTCLQRNELPVISISDHVYHVLDISYNDKQITLLDTDINLDENICPQPKRNFSLPSSPSWVNYSLPHTNNFVTIFHSCNSTNLAADADLHLLCSPEHLNFTKHLNLTKLRSPEPSYAFYQDQVPSKGSDWYKNCAGNVVIPVSDSFGLVSNRNYIEGIKTGFVMEWSATGWCEDCERSGGLCWSNSTATACACKRNDTTCPAFNLPAGVPPTPSPARKSQHSNQGMATGLKIMFGALAGFGGLLLIALLVFHREVNHSSLSISHWRNKNKSPINVEVFLEKYECLARRYNYSDIKKMTSSFKDALGEGGYGRVFKGELRDGRLVAVKVLNEAKGDGEDFVNEVATIGRTNHVNVVNLVGFCIEGTRRALVYEFMTNGSLEKFIYTQEKSSTTPSLGWEKLYQISLGIARGLEYLHRGCNARILHFDIKPHNILLDENFCPKISDFGLAKLYPTRESNVSTVGARGTMGYIAPELYSSNFGNVSHKSDVYSYGMMMLEMIGGRKNIDATVLNISQIYFPHWIFNHLKRNNDGEGLQEMHAAQLFEDENAKKMSMVALWCIQAHPMDRPSMSKVIEMLEGNTHELQMPPKPFIDPHSSSSASS